jgi:hypothetical protein
MDRNCLKENSIFQKQDGIRGRRCDCPTCEELNNKYCQSCRAKIEADKEAETRRKCWELVRCYLPLNVIQQIKKEWLGDK